MRKLELICDSCGKTAKGDEEHCNLPEGWYIVGYHAQSFVAYDDWRVTHHFCSSECLNKVMDVTIPKKRR